MNIAWRHYRIIASGGPPISSYVIDLANNPAFSPASANIIVPSRPVPVNAPSPRVMVQTTPPTTQPGTGAGPTQPRPSVSIRSWLGSV